MIRPLIVPLVVLLLGWFTAPPDHSRSSMVSGRVIDATTRAPLTDAIVTAGDREFRTDSAGRFSIDAAQCDVMGFRAHGYSRTVVTIESLRGDDAQIALIPFRPGPCISPSTVLEVRSSGRLRLRSSTQPR